MCCEQGLMLFTVTVDTEMKVALKLYSVHTWHCSVRWPVVTMRVHL